MRSIDPSSSPFVALTIAHARGKCGLARRATSRTPCDGAAMTTNCAPSRAAAMSFVGERTGGSSMPGK
jgi:hypothetical protein